MYLSTKTYGHEVGLSVCFRQWSAKSHCSLLHGYALSVRIEFGADRLDVCNWVIDFGGLKSFKEWLVDHFDHTLVVACDDPHRAELCDLDTKGLARVILLDEVGCEAFAQFIYEGASMWLHQQGHASRVHVHKVTVAEHGANSASYTKGN